MILKNFSDNHLHPSKSICTLGWDYISAKNIRIYSIIIKICSSCIILIQRMHSFLKYLFALNAE